MTDSALFQHINTGQQAAIALSVFEQLLMRLQEETLKKAQVADDKGSLDPTMAFGFMKEVIAYRRQLFRLRAQVTQGTNARAAVAAHLNEGDDSQGRPGES